MHHRSSEGSAASQGCNTLLSHRQNPYGPILDGWGFAGWRPTPRASRNITCATTVLRYHRPALLHDWLRCTTWIGEIRGAQCQRFVRIERATDGVLLCEAETQWMLLDPATQRPKRVEAEVEQRLWEPVG